MAKRKGNSGTHRVMTGLFLELAGRLPVLNHGHQSHRERRWPVCCAVAVASVNVAQVSGGSRIDDEEETMVDVDVAEVCFVCVGDCARPVEPGRSLFMVAVAGWPANLVPTGTRALPPQQARARCRTQDATGSTDSMQTRFGA